MRATSSTATARLRPWWAMGAALAAVALVWALSRDGEAAVDPDTASATTSASPAFVKSQEGTEPDGKLLAQGMASAAGDNVPLAYAELRRMFDYYFSAQGEQSLPSITQQIQTELNRRLSPAQAQKARRLLDLYLVFKRALVRLEARPGLAGSGVASMRQRMLAQQDLRAEYFSAEELEGMFGFEDAMDADAIARLEISQNAKLNAAQKKEQLAALDAAMPAALRADRDATQAVTRVEQRAADMRAQGASDDEIFRMRAKAFDTAAASRLAELDREEAAWKQRIGNYLEARDQVLKAQANASPSERLQALTNLQQSQFREAEQRRLAAYEPR